MVAVHFVELGPKKVVVIVAVSEQTKVVPWVFWKYVRRADLGFCRNMYQMLDKWPQLS